MARYLNSFLIPLSIGAVAAVVMIACGSDEAAGPSPSSGGTGGDGGTGGAPGGAGGVATTGGAAPTGGAGPTGGAPATGGAATDGGGELFTCLATQADRDPDPSGTAASGAECCTVDNGNNHLGTCQALSSLSSDPFAENYGVAGCNESAGLVCVPKPDAEQPNSGDTPSCTIDLGGTDYEGRCIPRCFVISTPGAANLNAGDCDATGITGITVADVVCAPCFSPIDGSATGACTRRAGDAPVITTAPAPFQPCGRYPADDTTAPYLGLCVPIALIEAAGQSNPLIPQDTCATGELCAPKNKIEDTAMCFATCVGALGTATPDAPDSVCVPTYIVESPGSPGVGFSSVLGPVTCGTGETCTPCISPIDQTVTSACGN